MSWYVVSVVHAFVPLKEPFGRIPVYEDAYLIEADSYDEAHKYGLEQGKLHNSIDDSSTVCGKPAKNIFLGIRKITSVFNPPPLDQDADRPIHLTELTHSYFEADSLEHAQALARGEAVKIMYVDDAEYDYKNFPLNE